MNMERYDIFVSYAHEDKKIVGEIIGKLSSAGLSVWVDKEIHHGESISARIVKAIEKATFVLFFSSKNSNASDYCIGEILVAVQKKKCIIPIKIDSSDYCDDLIVYLIRLHYVNFIEGFSEEEYDELVSVLSGSILSKAATIEMNGKRNHNIGCFQKTYLFVAIWTVLCVCGCVGIMTYLHSKSEKDDVIECSGNSETARLPEDKTEELRKTGTFYSTSGNNEASINIIVPENEVEIFVNEWRKKGVKVNVHEGNICSCSGSSKFINEIEYSVNNEWTGYTISQNRNK